MEEVGDRVEEVKVLIAPGISGVHTCLMKFEAKVGERGEIVIPDDVRAELGLVPDAAIKVEIAVAVPRVARREPDWETIDELVTRLGEPMRVALLADGYATFDEYIDDIRGR